MPTHLQTKKNVEWNLEARNIVKAEMHLRNMSYPKLVERLQEMGIDENVHNVRNKINRGRFNVCFLMQIMVAMGCSSFRIERDN